MSQQSENMDFSGLFKLDVLLQQDIANHTFYEVGLKKYLAVSNNKELIFLYINAQSERFDSIYDWDFLDNPVYCMCFEPSGTWVLIVSDEKVLLVPFLPLFIPQYTYDCKWSLSSVTVLPLLDIPQPTSVVWWLTKESENIIIISSKSGIITFYSLESQSVVGETRVSGEVIDLQICFDDSLDLLALLISKGPTQQWKLVLEHRSLGYNWLQQIRAQSDRKDGFMSYIKQLSKDKITFFTQGGSKGDSKIQTVEYLLKPTEYLPTFRKNSNSWALTAQYVNGRHFLTAFELNEGIIILESPAEDTPSRTLRPNIKNDGTYIQGLWSQKIIYLLKKNHLEIHSTQFSQTQGEVLLGVKKDSTMLWSADMMGEVKRAYLMSAKEPGSLPGGWRVPTFMSDLQLPRFILEPCLIITTNGAFVLNTVSSPCEWLVGLIVRGGSCAEQSCAALGTVVPPLLRAAADLLLARGKIAPAHYLYTLSRSPADGWVARLGVFGRLHELSMYKQAANVGNLGNAAITAKLLALLLKIGTNCEDNFDMDVKFTNLSPVEFQELSCVAACIGLWEFVPIFSVHRGNPILLLNAIKSKSVICRGAIVALLNQKCLVPVLLEENGQWFFDFIAEKCNKFDTIILKRLCLWLNPLQDQLRPVMRDLKQGITSIYTTRMLQLITTFMHIACVLESRDPRLDIQTNLTLQPGTWVSSFTPRRSLSCGLGHWGLTDDGNAKIMAANTPVNTELIGKVVDIACGRHHTLLLTENGIYAAGDNSYGQLGVGCRWGGAVGDAAIASGELLHVSYHWTAPLVVVSAGHYHSAAVDVGGRLYTWGWGVHGQLCLGSVDDQYSPRLVTKLQGRKVLNVGCGSCHTVVLMKNGEVWSCGAGVFGQLAAGCREKSSLPLRVLIQDAVDDIAVGYFHNLALTNKNQLWCWGSSPQQLRAASAKRNEEDNDDGDRHLALRLVDTSHVRGRIVRIAAGWHHSCIIDNTGTLYTWGLNFDGQLGTGDRKQVKIPVEVKIPNESQTEPRSPDKIDPKENTKCLVACGGDFTIFIDDNGKIYSTGNMHLQGNNELEKLNNRIIMMKTTKRVIKIPAARNNKKFVFQAIDSIDIMFPFDIDDITRKDIEPRKNPLGKISDFQNKSWADDMTLLLKPWINEDILSTNKNMAAKLAYHSDRHSDCLRYMLDNLKNEVQSDRLYLTHQDSEEKNGSVKKDEVKIIITNIISQRIKDVSLAILNEEPYPVVEPSVYRTLPCCCDEMKYTRKDKSEVTTHAADLSKQAADVIDKCISIFPVDSALWEQCFRLAKDFYVQNDLIVADLETVLRKYMETNATTMAAAIMYSDDCAQYSEILSPKFYLNMCSDILDTWG
ncbi:hypothetical protein KGM_215867 [Danaus plexippus plexippus]|uniref:Uncharacterized protein n=1 Tax=Danaus plexippus plexippus TaxID=278856 RepID=A0A212FM22_DANPL|nr:hypothetical protein KGM_215867 [Danaus plexippus plexippus]